ncbi:glycosyltransferase family 39 protein [Allorhizobium sp. BGMRC 0089]|uniref:ArnT family glycosyltransferase n=1 Tax=Allorhizobium sonneratiae TaxID=2934936 RepID=UPI002034076E|nr:glycosyltransferase family 39 protein [Allorhizobium sonneratiae]MCM2293178.1 glycosyltransferase family 39 protein [Allorhizobium sonneratiae]
MAQSLNPQVSKLTIKSLLMLLVLSLIVFLPGLSTMPPTDRDESLFSQASKQMVETHNFVDIKVRDKPRYQKPIGIYWLQSASVMLTHPARLNEIWAYRLPSALGMTLAVIMTAATGAVLFTPSIGFMAGLLLMACTIVNVEARLATTDAALLAMITTVQFSLARAWQGDNRWRNGLLFWFALGFGLLLKGPIILLPLLGTLFWMWRSQKSLRWALNLRPLPGLVILLLVVCPWLIAITMASHGAFMEQSAGKDLMDKIWNGQNRGMIPPGFHLLILPVTLFPTSIFVYMALPDVWQKRHQAAIAFCLGWLIPSWLVFEISLTKLAHYTMPTFPALALLGSWGLAQGYPALKSVWLKRLFFGSWFVIGLIFAGAFIALDLNFGGSLQSLSSWCQIGAGLALILAQGLTLYFFKRERQYAALASVVLGSVIFMTVVFAVTLPGLKGFWLAPQVVAAVDEAKLCDHPQLVTYGYDEPSLVFLGGTQTLSMDTPNDTAAAVTSAPCRFAVVNVRLRDHFVSALASQLQQKTVSLEPLKQIEGFDLGSGHWYDLLVYPPPPSAEK